MDSFRIASLLGLVIIALVACGPSEGDIQTAIAQTEEAQPTATGTARPSATPEPTITPEPTDTPTLTATPQPTNTPTETPEPTRIPLSKIELESILIRPGDLPGHLAPGQIHAQVPFGWGGLDELPPGDNFASQRFYDTIDGRDDGGVVVFLYEDLDVLESSYEATVAEMKAIFTLGYESEFRPDIGEHVYGVGFDHHHLAFTRCHALVYVWTKDTRESEIIAYGARLDERLSSVVCSDG